LHQQSSALTAKCCAGDQSHTFFLRRQHHVGDVRIGLTQPDELAVAGIGNVADLTNADTTEMRVDGVGPGGFDTRRGLHGLSVISAARALRSPLAGEGSRSISASAMR